MLQLASRWRDISLDVTGGNHATSLYITTEGIFKYFDSNNELKAPDFSSPEELADYIIETKYKNLNKLHADGTFEINLNAYKFYNLKPENVPSIEPPLMALSYTYDDDSPNGFTELHYAVMENNAEKVSRIIKRNPESLLEVNAHGNNALHLAVYNNNKKIINILLAAQLDVNQVNNNQDTALHIAIDWGYDNSLAALLKDKKTDLNKADSLGRTPLVMAIQNRDRSAIQLLLDHGAVIDKNALKAAKKIDIVDRFITQYLSAKDSKSSMLNAFHDQRSDSKSSFTIENSNNLETQPSLSKVKPKS
jgi:ankyrin repeat protein